MHENVHTRTHKTTLHNPCGIHSRSHAYVHTYNTQAAIAVTKKVLGRGPESTICGIQPQNMARGC